MQLELNQFGQILLGLKYGAVGVQAVMGCRVDLVADLAVQKVVDLEQVVRGVYSSHIGKSKSIDIIISVLYQYTLSDKYTKESAL